MSFSIFDGAMFFPSDGLFIFFMDHCRINILSRGAVSTKKTATKQLYNSKKAGLWMTRSSILCSCEWTTVNTVDDGETHRSFPSTSYYFRIPTEFLWKREKTGMFYFYVRKIPPFVDAAEENKSPKNRCLFESFIDIECVQWNIHVEKCVAKGS